jgi:hypothetical protein
MSTLIGQTRCWNPACTVSDAGVYETPGGVLIAKCHRCQSECSGRKGTKANRDLRALTSLHDDAPSPVKPVAAAVAAMIANTKKPTTLLG